MKYIRELIEYTGVDSCPYGNFNNFKEIMITNVFSLDATRPNIGQLVKVNATAKIDSYQTVQAPNLRIIISGTITLIYQYVTDDLTQSMYSSNTIIQFSDFIPLQATFNPLGIIITIVSIKDIYCTVQNPKTINNSLILLLDAEND